MKIFSCLLISILMFTACNTSPQAAKNPVFGLLEVRIEGGEGQTSSATARFVNPDHLRQTKTLTSYPYYTNSSLSFFRQSVAFIDNNDQQATTDINTTKATRYITATFNITNDTGTTFNNLYLVATSVPTGVDTTIGGTAFKTIQRGNGTLETSAAVAQKILPAGGVSARVNGVAPQQDMTDLQYLTPVEAILVQTQAAAFTPSLDLDPLEYAFAAHNGNNRSIAGTGGTGTVTLGFKLPKINPRNANPFAFVVYYVVVNDSNTFASQTPEEQPNLSLNSAFDTLTSSYRVLDGSRLMDRDDLQPMCAIAIARVRVGGGNSQYYRYNPAHNLAPLSPAIGDDSCDFGASGRRTKQIGVSLVNTGNAVVVAPFGGIYVVGSVGSSPNRNIGVWKMTANGNTDTSFASNGTLTIDLGGDDVGTAAALDDQNRLVIGGSNGIDLAFVRLLADGSFDTSFSGDGILTFDFDLNLVDKVSAIAISGSTIFAAQTWKNNFAVVKLLPSGNLDTSFSTDGKNYADIGAVGVTPGGIDVANGIAISSTGTIYVVGSTTSATSNPPDSQGLNTAYARFLPNGALDQNFFYPGYSIYDLAFGQDDQANDILLYPPSDIANAGKILICGYVALDDFFHSTNAFVVQLGGGAGFGRFFGLDSFDTASSIEFDSSTNVNNIVVSGSSANPLLGISDFLLARLLPNGSLDTSFSGDGMMNIDINNTNDTATGLAGINSNGDNDYMVVGTAASGSTSSFAVVRIEN